MKDLFTNSGMSLRDMMHVDVPSSPPWKATRPNIGLSLTDVKKRDISRAESRSRALDLLSSYEAGPEEVVNLRGLLVQSSKWFGIKSVQFSSLVTSLSGKFVRFSSGHGDQVPPFSLVQFRLSSVHLDSNCLGGAEEQF